MKSEEKLEFDVIFKKLKPYGRYNLIVFLSYQLLWFGMACDLVSNFTSIGGLKPDYQCSDVDLQNETNTCTIIHNCSKANLTVVSQFYSIYEEFEWACINMAIPWTTASLSWAMAIPGYLVAGHLADRFGRKWLIFGGLCWYHLNNIIAASSPTWQFYLGVGLVGSVVWPIYGTPMYPLLMETVGKKYRLLQSFAFQWIIAYPVAGLVAYLTHNWRVLIYTDVAIGAPTLIAFFFMQESPRWLIQKKRYEEAAIVLNRIAMVNGQKIKFTPQELTMIDVGEDPKAHITDALKLFTNRVLLKYTIALVSMSIAISQIWNVIFMNIQDLAGSPFLNVALLGILRAWSPIAILLERKVKRFGRRMQLLGTMSIVLCCFIFIVVVYAFGYREKLHVLTTAVALFAFALSVSLGGLAKDQLETELFPTVIRATALSVIDVIRVAGGALGPQLVYLGNYWNGFPYLGASAFIALALLLCFMFIPETKDRTLPDNFRHKTTIQEEIETSV